MKSIINSLLAMTLAFLSVQGVRGEVRMNPVFTGDMVLQQQARVMLRGTAAPGSRVMVKAGWRSGSSYTRADAGGDWMLPLDTPVAGGPYDIVVSDRDGSITLGDVLIGDVWVCGGQSNMEMPMRGFHGQPVEGTLDMIARARGDRPVRLFRQRHAWS
ncbi:MAG: 9-O-acetylesterase, partial [Muribaculaceae bacterium]|nr:9-O-acetylesterase [Muribaculaceae bacterium]